MIHAADRAGKRDKPGPAASISEAATVGFNLASFQGLMAQALSHFQQELGKIHAGRASPGLLEPIEVVSVRLTPSHGLSSLSPCTPAISVLFVVQRTQLAQLRSHLV